MKITEKAASKVREIMEAHGGEYAGILITFEGGYKLDLVKEDDASGYVRIECPHLGVFSRQEDLTRAEAAEVDFIDEGPSSGFKVTRERREGDSLLLSQIQEIIDNEINPAVAMHGGHITILDVEGKRVFVQMGGGCAGCGMADVTLKSGIEARLQQLDPEIVVMDTTDHASGSNPYYAPQKK
ncbi:MAG: NifU family protein [Nitrospinota bacterium]